MFFNFFKILIRAESQANCPGNFYGPSCGPRFEAGDITGIVELDALIRVNRLTHRLLSKHLALGNYRYCLKIVFHRGLSRKLNLFPFREISIFTRTGTPRAPNFCLCSRQLFAFILPLNFPFSFSLFILFLLHSFLFSSRFSYFPLK
jgi:hypothetical protein